MIEYKRGDRVKVSANSYHLGCLSVGQLGTVTGLSSAGLVYVVWDNHVSSEKGSAWIHNDYEIVLARENVLDDLRTDTENVRRAGYTVEVTITPPPKKERL